MDIRVCFGSDSRGGLLDDTYCSPFSLNFSNYNNNNLTSVSSINDNPLLLLNEGCKNELQWNLDKSNSKEQGNVAFTEKLCL